MLFLREARDETRETRLVGSDCVFATSDSDAQRCLLEYDGGNLL